MAQATTTAWRREMEGLLARARAVLTTDNPDQFWLEHVEKVIATFTENLIMADGAPRGFSVSKDLESLVGPPSFLGRGGSRQNHQFYAGWTAAAAQYALALRRPTQKQRERWLEFASLDVLNQDPADRRQNIERGRRGGRAGAGKAKRPHSELIRRAVAALVENKQPVTARSVRLLFKSGWQSLAFEWDDPLHDIVDVRVLEQGPIQIEYTAKWARDHPKPGRFVRLGNPALQKQIDRAAG